MSQQQQNRSTSGADTWTGRTFVGLSASDKHDEVISDVPVSQNEGVNVEAVSDKHGECTTAAAANEDEEMEVDVVDAEDSFSEQRDYVPL